jgi:hypothetical protein
LRSANSITGVTLPIACGVVAMVPDVDLLITSHRTFTHSIGAVLVVGIATWLILRRSPYATGWIFAIAAAYGSHLLLDWLGKDSSRPIGLTVLWPFSSRFYISGLDLFREVSRRYWNFDEFVLGNLNTLGWEFVVLAPVAALAWTLRKTRRL